MCTLKLNHFIIVEEASIEIIINIDISFLKIFWKNLKNSDDDVYTQDHWVCGLWLALSKEANRVRVSFHSHEDGNIKIPKHYIL
jgi:hypothetical protein